jgi:hypothetical protein
MGSPSRRTSPTRSPHRILSRRRWIDNARPGTVGPADTGLQGQGPAWLDSGQDDCQQVAISTFSCPQLPLENNSDVTRLFIRQSAQEEPFSAREAGTRRSRAKSALALAAAASGRFGPGVGAFFTPIYGAAWASSTSVEVSSSAPHTREHPAATCRAVVGPSPESRVGDGTCLHLKLP